MCIAERTIFRNTIAIAVLECASETGTRHACRCVRAIVQPWRCNFSAVGASAEYERFVHLRMLSATGKFLWVSAWIRIANRHITRRVKSYIYLYAHFHHAHKRVERAVIHSVLLILVADVKWAMGRWRLRCSLFTREYTSCIELSVCVAGMYVRLTCRYTTSRSDSG